MNDRYFFSVVVSFVLMFFCTVSFAQRQTPGRPSIGGTFSFSKALYGGTVSWCDYQYLGHTSLSLEVVSHPYYHFQPEVVDDDGFVLAEEELASLRCIDVAAGGGYYLRFLASRSRSVILSGGVNAYLGARLCKELSNYYAPNTMKVENTAGLLMYIVPELQFEVFPFSNVSFFLSARPHVEILNLIIGGSYVWFMMNFATGIKVYL